MLRTILVALLALALAAPAVATLVAAHTPSDPTDEVHDIPWSQLTIDDSMLPASTGWFLVPITTDRPAYIRFATDIFAGGNGGEVAWAPLLAIDQGYQAPILSFGTTGAMSMTEVSHGGEVARCCDDMWVSYSYAWGEGPEVVLALVPGQTAWFGMAAAGWTEYDDMWLEVSGQALITAGEPRTGERVAVVDLFQEARQAGTSVRLLGGELVTLPAPVERTWTSESYGVFALDAYGWTDARATLTIEIPNEAVRTTQIGDEQSAYAGAHRAGTYRVALSDLEGPSPQPLVFGSPWMYARAMFIDVDVPGDAAFIWTSQDHADAP